MGVPPNGWSIKMDDLGVPLLQEIHIQHPAGNGAALLKSCNDSRSNSERLKNFLGSGFSLGLLGINTAQTGHFHDLRMTFHECSAHLLSKKKTAILPAGRLLVEGISLGSAPAPQPQRPQRPQRPHIAAAARTAPHEGLVAHQQQRGGHQGRLHGAGEVFFLG